MTTGRRRRQKADAAMRSTAASELPTGTRPIAYSFASSASVDAMRNALSGGNALSLFTSEVIMPASLL